MKYEKPIPSTTADIRPTDEDNDERSEDILLSENGSVREEASFNINESKIISKRTGKIEENSNITAVSPTAFFSNTVPASITLKPSERYPPITGTYFERANFAERTETLSYTPAVIPFTDKKARKIKNEQYITHFPMLSKNLDIEFSLTEEDRLPTTESATVDNNIGSVIVETREVTEKVSIATAG